MRLIWLRQAEGDLDAIFDYLIERDPQVARRMLDTIRHHISLLSDQPSIGRIGRVPDTRELVIARTPYIVAYTVDERLGAVLILRVLHSAQRWPADFDDG